MNRLPWLMTKNLALALLLAWQPLLFVATAATTTSEPTSLLMAGNDNSPKTGSTHSRFGDNSARERPIAPAQVLTVIDGNTLRLKTDNNTFIATLAYIDAPEPEQPYGKQSHHHLKQLLHHKNVLIQPAENEWLIFKSGENINLNLLRDGHAWPNKALSSTTSPASSDAAEYLKAYQFASENSIGLWALEHDLRVTPWQWRKQSVEISPRKEYKFKLSNPFLQNTKTKSRTDQEREERNRIQQELSTLRTKQTIKRAENQNRPTSPAILTEQPKEPIKDDQNR